MKGSIDDIFYIVATFFGLALFLLLIAMVAFAFNDQIQANSNFDATSKLAVNNWIVGGFDTLFNILPLVFFGFYAIALILASQIQSHPIFMPLSILIAGIIVIFASILGFIYTTIASQTAMLTITARYPVLTFMLGNYAWFAAIMIGGMYVMLHSRLAVKQ